MTLNPVYTKNRTPPILGTRFDPNFKPAELELVAEANIQETG
jgi:hypothetical protein